MNRPVYVFSGFLDSGKTTSIKRTLIDPRFTENEKTLIICLEEGDETYDEAFLKESNSVVEYVDFDSLNPSLIKKLDEIHHPDRLFIEFNGMQDDRQLLYMKLPNGFEFAQDICTVDASKFKLFVTNMPQFMFNHISVAETIVLNRYDGQDFKYLRNNIKTMNRYGVICLEDKDGNMFDFPTYELFDVNNLDISDDDYGLFYMDVVENVKRYENKAVKFNGFMIEEMKDANVVGRFAMVCCANDLQRFAIKVTGLKEKLEVGKYYHIEGIIRLDKTPKGIRLYIEGKNVNEIDKPEQEYVNFS